MTGQDRIGPAEAEVVVFNKGGRDFRYERLERGEEAPRDFFYGFFELKQAGIEAAMQSTSGNPGGLLGSTADFIERAASAITGVGVRPLSLRLQDAWLRGAKVAISYTDGFSLTLGLHAYRKRRPILIGGFHGLSDIESRLPVERRRMAHAIIRRSLAGLDYAFFFGPADREFALARYGLVQDRTSVIPFGVDTDFWRPVADTVASDFVVAVGQDQNRDYDLLVRAPGEHPILIVTKQKLTIPEGTKNVEVSSGNYFASESVTDVDLRRLYNEACAVVVPLKDVRQPTGYSVTLQAMSCGRPVILSNIKGLWTRTLLRDGENCVLVPPGDSVALGQAIGRLRNDRGFGQKIGQNARETALAHYGLDSMGAATVGLARLGIALKAERSARVSGWVS